MCGAPLLPLIPPSIQLTIFRIPHHCQNIGTYKKIKIYQKWYPASYEKTWKINEHKPITIKAWEFPVGCWGILGAILGPRAA